MRATTAQLYPGRDTFEFDQGHMTKNQPITVLILLSESLDIINKWKIRLEKRVNHFTCISTWFSLVREAQVQNALFVLLVKIKLNMI